MTTGGCSSFCDIRRVQKAFSVASSLECNQYVSDRELIPSAFNVEPVLFSIEIESILRISGIEPTPQTFERAVRKSMPAMF